MQSRNVYLFSLDVGIHGSSVPFEVYLYKDEKRGRMNGTLLLYERNSSPYFLSRSASSLSARRM